jgi:hypothetical protein
MTSKVTVIGAGVAAVGLAALMVMHWQTEGGVYSAGRDAHGETTVIAPGHKLYAENKATSVAGTDACPDQHGLAATIFGQPLSGHKDCIVLAPDRTSVAVTVEDRSSKSREVWAVQWHGGEARLYRPNGELVKLVEG